MAESISEQSQPLIFPFNSMHLLRKSQKFVFHLRKAIGKGPPAAHRDTARHPKWAVRSSILSDPGVWRRVRWLFCHEIDLGKSSTLAYQYFTRGCLTLLNPGYFQLVWPQFPLYFSFHIPSIIPVIFCEAHLVSPALRNALCPTPLPRKDPHSA